MKELKKILIYLALACAAFYLWMFIFLQPTIGLYYPFADDRSIYEQSDTVFYTRAGCREWGRIRLMGEGEDGDGFACARDCVYDQRRDLYQCSKISPIYKE